MVSRYCKVVESRICKNTYTILAILLIILVSIFLTWNIDHHWFTLFFIIYFPVHYLYAALCSLLHICWYYVCPYSHDQYLHIIFIYAILLYYVSTFLSYMHSSFWTYSIGFQILDCRCRWLLHHLVNVHVATLARHYELFVPK